MKASQHIRKIFIISLWVVMGAGVAVLLVAAIRLKREKICKGYEIDIHGSEEARHFIDKKDVVQLLTMNGNETINGKSTIHFDLQKKWKTG